MNDWLKERNAVLSWWPRFICGSKPDGYMFMEAMEESLYLVSNENEWKIWLDQCNKIWAEDHYDFLTNSTNIEDHFGPTLGYQLKKKFLNLGAINLFFNSIPLATKKTLKQEIINLSENLQKEFNLKSVIVSRHSSDEWLIKQLKDAFMGFTTMALVLGIENKSVGEAELVLWFNEKSRNNGSLIGSGPNIEIHNFGGDISRSWIIWKLSRKNIDFTDIKYSWKKSWGSGESYIFERKSQFLEKSRQALKDLIDLIPVTTDMGQRTFRRYRAACKWIDDIKKGVSQEVARQSWNKLKTGNRIAWSGEHSNGYESIVKNWIWEEQLIESEFWKKSDWLMPAWVKRAQALGSDSNSTNTNIYMEIEENFLYLWALGFEGVMRQRIGYDSWIAKNQISHPSGIELNDFDYFFQESLLDQITKK